MSKHTLAPVFGTTEQERSLLDPSLYIGRFQDLDQAGKCMAEYVWIGGTGMLSVLSSWVHALWIPATLQGLHDVVARYGMPWVEYDHM